MDLVLDLTKINIPSEKKERKPPGRPKKVSAKCPDPRSGVITKPTIDDALFELFYCNPDAFKKALGFYLSLSDMPLDCTFTPGSVSFLALDRYKKSKIQISFDLNKLNHYYCKPGITARFGISNQYLELPAKTISNDLSSLKWYSIDGKTDETYIDYQAPEYKETHHDTLICCGRYQPIDDAGFDDSDYQIRWQWKSRWFKKKLTKSKVYGDQLTIKQVGAEYPLMFIYSNQNGHSKSDEILEGKDEMNFTSNIKPGEIFNISVQIKYWYPVANSSMLNSVVHISLHKEKPIMTKIFLDDGAICIKVLTSINDIRQDTDITTSIPSSHSVRPVENLSVSPSSRVPSPSNSRLGTPINSPPVSPRLSVAHVITPINERMNRILPEFE